MFSTASTRLRFGARITVAFAAAGLAAATSIWAAPTASAAPASDAGLFGVQDPSYDGVYRQSLSVLALHAAGAPIDATAITWLKQQQCADGTWTAYRADVSVACDATKEDSNATGMAIQALAAIGQLPANAVAGLKTFQLAGGGFYSNQVFGAPASDANSTGIALSALVAAGVDPASVQSGGQNGFDFLRTLQVPGCGAAESGAYDYQPETPLHANDYATVQAALGMEAAPLPVAPRVVDPAAATCPASVTDTATSVQAAASYLAARLTAGSGLIPSIFGGGSDYSSTANAALALTVSGTGGTAIGAAASALAANVTVYTVDGAGAGVPAAFANLILVAHATGANPAAFGGKNLLSALQGTLRAAPAPASPPAPAPEPSKGAPPVTDPATLPLTGAPTLVIAGSAAALLLAGGLLLLRTRRSDAPGA